MLSFFFSFLFLGIPCLHSHHYIFTPTRSLWSAGHWVIRLNDLTCYLHHMHASHVPLRVHVIDKFHTNRSKSVMNAPQRAYFIIRINFLYHFGVTLSFSRLMLLCFRFSFQNIQFANTQRMKHQTGRNHQSKYCQTFCFSFRPAGLCCLLTNFSTSASINCPTFNWVVLLMELMSTCFKDFALWT